MEERQKLFIVGAGGHGGELCSYLRDLESVGKGVELVGVIDEKKPPGPWRNSQIFGDFSAWKSFLLAHPDQLFFYTTAVGDNRARLNLVSRVEAFGVGNIRPWTLRHPTSGVGSECLIGEGTCLAPLSVVTTHARIGRHCILNVKASVSHDAVVGDYVNINPGATLAGNTRVGDGAYIGAGATLIDRVSVGAWSVIGAGAVVINDIPDHVTAVGVPAHPIKRHQTKAA